jgi:hypothetical protein
MTDIMRMPVAGGPPPAGGPRSPSPVHMGMAEYGLGRHTAAGLNITPESLGGPPLAAVQAALAQRPPQAPPPGGPRVYGWTGEEPQTPPPGGPGSAVSPWQQVVSDLGLSGTPGARQPGNAHLQAYDAPSGQPVAPSPTRLPGNAHLQTYDAPAPPAPLPTVPGVTVGQGGPQSFEPSSLAVDALSGGPENVGQVITRVLGGATAAQRARFWTLMSRPGTRDDAMKLLQEVESGGVPLTARQRMESEEGLRREFATLAKPYFEMRDAFSRIEASVESVSPAGDMALIFNFMKMLDPGSVVREGEFATAQNAAGVPDRVLNLYNRMLSGERLNPTQRTDFVTQARRLLAAQQRQYQGIQTQIGTIAQRGGLNPDNVLIDFTAPPSAAAGQPEGGPGRPAVRIAGDEEYRALPSGARFVGPDGIERTKP